MPSSAVLEIHVINVGQGDSILIINRDLALLRQALGQAANAIANDVDLLPTALRDNPAALAGTVRRALLIDAGEDMYGESVVGYLETQGVLTKGTVDTPNLSVLMSHYHSDHIGGLPYLFITEKTTTVSKKQERYNRKTKRTDTVWVQTTVKEKVARYRPGRLYYAEKTAQDNCIGAYNLVFGWATKAGNATTQIPIRAGGLEPAQANQAAQPLVIDLGTGASNIPIRLRAVAAIAQVWNVENNTLQAAPVNNRVDPNDRSVVLVLEYGSFRGFFGADIAGNGVDAGGNAGNYGIPQGSKKPFSQHGDVESVLMPMMQRIYPRTAAAQGGQSKWTADGYSTFYKVSHHGSSSSTDIYSLGRMTPRIAVISSGLKERFHSHPTQQVMNRLGEIADWATAAAPTVAVANTTRQTNAQPCGIFVTEIAARAQANAFGVTLNNAPNIGDVIVRPIDESIVAVRDATAFGTAINVQVYGSGIQTELDAQDQRNTLRDNAPRKDTGTAPYPIGPFLMACNKH
jgi:beta-lactamase superfamily II metal-dependent hydrolase